MAEWVLLKVVFDEPEAEIIKGLLQSNGIEVKITSSKVQPYPVNIGKLGEIKIFVREGALQKAEGLLRETASL